MQARPITIAQKLLNLYRQQHVIFGGWASVNAVFVAEGTPEVLAELKNLPTGAKLVQHIENLKSGKTKIGDIDRALLPYNGMMTDNIAQLELTEAEVRELGAALRKFTPNAEGLGKIRSLPMVKKYGDEWMFGIKAALSNHPDLAAKWQEVYRTERAYYLWKIANDILAIPLSERTRAQVQADLPEYETYLPMFGDAGKELLGKLRTFVSM